MFSATQALVAELVATVLRSEMDKKSRDCIGAATCGEQVPPADQARFVEVVENEKMSLHEGNIARYRLRPVEYDAWRQDWR